jgi:uncharacterized protein
MAPMPIRPDAVEAIDLHVHVLASIYPGRKMDAAAQSVLDHFGVDLVPTLPDMVSYYRERRMAFVAFTVDNFSRTGTEPDVSNEEIGRLAERYEDTVIPFASVDPRRGAGALRLAERLVRDYPFRGFKFHASEQEFYPNDPLAYPLYEFIQDQGLVALFHTGQTGVGAGKRGGGGIRLKYTNPLHIDDVAVDFPDMPIIMAHPSFPWQEEALSIAVHKPQVSIDLSGWSPKYFPPLLVQYANSLLKHKVMFGSDFPAITPDRWLADFDQLDIKPDVRPLILKENAARLFGLRDGAADAPGT